MIVLLIFLDELLGLRGRLDGRPGDWPLGSGDNAISDEAGPSLSSAASVSLNNARPGEWSGCLEPRDAIR